MTTATSSKAARRTLHYDTIDDLLKDAEQLAAGPVTMVGGWSLGQMLTHVAATIDYSIDGFPKPLPAPVRAIMRFVFKRRFLTKTLPAGFKSPKSDPRLTPPDTESAAGLQALRDAIARYRTASQLAMHPVVGTLTNEEWEQFHLRHAELHMSFATQAT